MHYLKKLKIVLLSNLWLIILVLFTSILYYKTYNTKLEQKESIDNYKFTGYIDKIVKTNEKIQLEIVGDKRILANAYLEEDTDINYLDNLQLGDYIEALGTLNVPSENTNFNLFNYRRYLLSKKIEYILSIDNLKIIGKMIMFFT